MTADGDEPLLRGWPAAAELALVTLLVGGLLVAFAISDGGMRLSWDALNHHIYLGWTAEHPRFDRDVLAAGTQAFQFPYLYWPVYRLAVGGAGAMTAGAVLAALQALAVPPLWLIARTCMPGARLLDAFMRLLGVGLAFLTGAVLSLLDASSNDLLAAIPLVWAIAFALIALERPADAVSARWVALSGLLAGVSAACKLSNGPLAVLLPLLWVFAAPGTLGARVRRAALGCGMTLAGFALTLGYWGTLLWTYYGNPLYPFFENVFAPLRAMVGWHP